MSGSRREALRTQFRASAVERLRKMWFALVQLNEGTASESVESEIARELHGLKGDAGLFQYDALSSAIHAIEEVFGAGQPGRDVPAVAGTLIGELEIVMRAVTEDPAAPAAVELLVGVQQRLSSASRTQSPAAVAPVSEEVSPSQHRQLQVDALRIDDLCDRLVEFHTQFAAFTTRLNEALDGQKEHRWALEELDRGRAALEELATSAWELRLSSVEGSMLELAQHARVLASQQGKRVRVDLQTGGAELERHILDAIREPLLHLVRNAIDHGLEPPTDRGTKTPTGTLVLHATTDGSRAEIVVGDDGRGIDLERIRDVAVKKGMWSDDARAPTMDEAFELLFARGFSTRGQATEISGRGVGLDVVRERVESLGGRVTVSSRLGEGTRFTLSVPTSIGRERYVVFESEGVVYGLPSRSVREIVQTSACRIERVTSGAVLTLRDEHLPYRALEDSIDEAGRVLIIDAGDRAQALGVPMVRGEFDLMRRPIDRLVAQSGYVAAAATFGDHRPVLLVAPLPFLRHLDRRTNGGGRMVMDTRRRVLVVDDSPLVRGLVASLLVGLGFEVLEAGNGLDALDVLAREEVHLVISDVEMPAMDGFDLLRRIRAQWAHVPVVMLTTRGSADDRRLASSLGANAYVVKSHFEQGHLVSAVRRLLGQVEA